MATQRWKKEKKISIYDALNVIEEFGTHKGQKINILYMHIQMHFLIDYDNRNPS